MTVSVMKYTTQPLRQGSSSNVRLVLEHVFKHLISWINLVIYANND